MTTLYVDNIAPNLNSTISAPNMKLPTGSVIQVKHATKTTRSSTASTAYVSTGFSIVITPKYSNSIIHVMCTGTGSDYAGVSTLGLVYKRHIGSAIAYSPLASGGHGGINSPNGATMGLYFGSSNTGTNKQHPFTMQWFDNTHNTTNQITYELMIATNNASGAVGIGGLGDNADYGSMTTLSVWEIAG